jgi:hypothetical protein
MKKTDFVFIFCVILFFLPFFVFPEVYRLYEMFNQSHGMIMSALKFGILSTMGECIGLRLQKGKYYEKGFGLILRAIVWGFLGVVINMAMIIFSKGTPSFLTYLGMTHVTEIMMASLSWQKIFIAFVTSLTMNCIFAPMFMTFHKITDTHILNTGGTLKGFFGNLINIGNALQQINWHRQWNFVFKKTIPLFWIPAHTITFVLSEQWRVLFAALLGVALGILLSLAGKKTKS